MDRYQDFIASAQPKSYQSIHYERESYTQKKDYLFR